MNAGTDTSKALLAARPSLGRINKTTARREHEQKIVIFVITTKAFGGLEVVLQDWLAEVDYSQTHAVIATTNRVVAARLGESSFPLEILLFKDRGPKRGFWQCFRYWRALFGSTRADTVVFLEGAPPPDYNLGTTLAGYISTKGNCFVYQGLAPLIEDRQSRRHWGFVPGIGLYWRIPLLALWLRSLICRKTLVMSSAIADRMTKHQRYPRRNIVVSHHGVDCERFRPSPAIRGDFRRRHSIPEDAVVVVSHGRLVPQKRVDRILRAFDILSVKHPNLWLVLTAGDELTGEVARIVEAMRNRGRVKMVEFLRDPSPVVQSGDIYVMASDNEGFGIALVEAMSAGLLCIATKVPGPSEILENGYNGLLVPATDDGVLEGLRSMLALSDAAKSRMSRNARNTVREKFELHRNVRAALETLRVPTLPLANNDSMADKTQSAHETVE